jgi:hypothetical protein
MCGFKRRAARRVAYQQLQPSRQLFSTVYPSVIPGVFLCTRHGRACCSCWRLVFCAHLVWHVRRGAFHNSTELNKPGIPGEATHVVALQSPTPVTASGPTHQDMAQPLASASLD